MKSFSKVIFLALVACTSANSIRQKETDLSTDSSEYHHVASFDEMEDMPLDGLFGVAISKKEETEERGSKAEKEEKKKDSDERGSKAEKEEKKKDSDDKKEKKKDSDDKQEKKSKSTKKPTSSSSRSTRKPTRKPTTSSSSKSTKKPTRKPTRKPTSTTSSSSSSSSSRDTRKCVDDESPRVNRDGRYRFNLVKSDAKCVDSDRNLYEYGQFDKVKKFSDCAEACVKDVRSSLLDTFRGYDFDCKKQRCRCLYDKGTLDSRNSGRFDRTNRDEYGDGPVDGYYRSTGYYCAKLAGAEFVEDEKDVVAEARSLRGFE